MDSFEQRIGRSPTNSFPDFDLWLQPQSSSFNPNNNPLDLLQDQPSLSTTFSSLSLSDSLKMPQSHSTSISQSLQLIPHTPFSSSTSISSPLVYQDVLGLTWPTTNIVSFDDFEMQDLSFLDIPFSTSTVVTTTPTATATVLLDYAFLGGNSVINYDTRFTHNAMNSLGYSPAPETQTPANILSQLAFPTTPAPHLPHIVPAPVSNSNSVNPFRPMANASDLFLPQMGTSFHPPLPPAEIVPTNLPLLWATIPSSTISISPSCDSSSTPAAQASGPSAMVYRAMNTLKTNPVQDTPICKAYSPTTFLLDASLMVKRAAAVAASRQAPIVLNSNAPFRQTSVSKSAGGLTRSTSYAPTQYSQEPKKRGTLELGGDDEGESNYNEGCLKLPETVEIKDSDISDHFTPSRCQVENSLLTPQPLLPYHDFHVSMQRSPSLPELKGNDKGNGKGKGKGRRSSLKQITDCAHYRPRNAFFMFRGFVSHIHTYLHAKQSSASILHSSASCSMTSTMMPLCPNSTEINNNNSGSSNATSSSPNFISFIPTDTQQPHLSLPSLPSKTQSPSLTFSTRRRRQAQTKVSVSCGKIWSSPCLPTCRPRLKFGLNNRSSSGCANCRMRSLFRQASDYLKLRQTEIERLIEFPPSSPECEDVDEVIPNTKTAMMGRKMLTRLEDSFNWSEFKQLYHHSDLFKWHRDFYTSQNADNENENNEAELDIEEMKAIWMENELAYEKVFSQGAEKRIAQESEKATSGITNSGSSNKRTALYY